MEIMPASNYLIPLKNAQLLGLPSKTTVLRLDLIDPLVSGNKWLKLQGWLKSYPKTRGISTEGGAWSNHIHAVAAFCQSQGLACRVYIKAKEGYSSEMIQDLRNWGVEIIFEPGRAHRSGVEVEKHWLHIPMGARGTPGQLGVSEFLNQLDHLKFDRVCCAAGTGTTAIGILKSSLQFNLLWVYNPGIKNWPEKTLIEQVDAEQPYQRTEFFCRTARFGKVTATQIEFMNKLYLQHQLPTDIIYTGTMMEALVQNSSSIFQPQDRVLIIHSGGLQGNRSLADGSLHF